jgi:hypothetical protein
MSRRACRYSRTVGRLILRIGDLESRYTCEIQAKAPIVPEIDRTSGSKSLRSR